ncbi:MAG: DNA protecting protein DprA [Gammaproteobacteria bacterium RIFCSPHIGHO2_02_FULL_42_13]|nr:MAG: DNA protecting protein DprA [Gammaproteobacteria bacterium RIFCSPHIGHO2_02_FULL_42_13]OGT68636.1 MAG: DNA protecting protein DprA [Gammaproteobacteria bacterium RIFCSPLOWO2_02_FULL_42_9]
MHSNLRNYLALNHILGLKSSDIQQILKYGDDDFSQLKEFSNINWSLIDAELKWAEEKNHHIVTCEDDHYPRLLKEIQDPPHILYIWGNLDCLAKPQLAIVGSRTPTSTGCETAYQFAQYFSQCGLVITSGLARGIDAASHEGALCGGETIAVLGGGLRHIYPKEHINLSARIAECGAVISEFPLEMRPQKFNFPRRNRLISGLSLGVLVVEAAARSGSLITARLAGEQGREVFAVPGSIHNPLSKGSHCLIRDGAKLVETAQDVINELSGFDLDLSKISPDKPKKPHHPLDDQHQKLLSCIGFELTTLDVLIIRSGCLIEIISSLLLSLELGGYIKEVPGGYCRIK